MLKINAPFGSNFSTKLEGASNKLICALSAATTCTDDAQTLPLQPWEPLRPEPILA